MPVYRAPVDDFRFLLHEFLEIDTCPDLFGDPDLIDDVLVSAGKFCEQVLQPLNLSGDEEGCRFENGSVLTPAGFKAAYKAFCDAGWPGLVAPAEYGGTGLPVAIAMAAAEMASSANQSFAMYPGLSAAATAALIATGAPWMKKHIVPKLVSGEWTGTMCLTEAGCGTDLKLMKTRAVEQPDGSFAMTGTKIFISGGDHDLTDNIIHMVIAKIPDADGRLKDDLAAVNFFMVPKVVVNADGTPGARNAVTVGGIEKKMGIKAQATCILNFDNAVAWRLGPKPQAGDKPSAGMAGMFAMMNAARIGVGLQGLAIAEVAIQNADAYVHERRAGRAPTGPADPHQPADLLVAHPDVKRMLLHGRAFADGARALALWTGLNVSIAASARPEAASAALVADLLTPVIKAFFTDMGFEAANLALQCFGGHGYIRDNGVEQFVRDGRINMIYEGANGVQAMDLVTRRLTRQSGAAPKALFAMIEEWLNDNRDAAMMAFVTPLQRGLASLRTATLWLSERANPNDAGAAATDYLRLMGIVSVGWMWARIARIALGKPASKFHRAKLTAAKYWMERVMPETALLTERIQAGSATIMEAR